MKVNMGCGPRPLPGYVNVDSRELDGVDVVDDVRSVVFPHGGIESIYAGHILEHLPASDAADAICHWLSLLRPGGDLTITIPDCDKALALLASGELIEQQVLPIFWGTRSDPPENWHRSAWSAGRLLNLLDAIISPDDKLELVEWDSRATGNPPWQSIVRVRKH